MPKQDDISRGITERIRISGRLKLLTPAHFGNGTVRGNALVDMSLLLDEYDSSALIPGTTIAGALRNYLRERLGGYGVVKEHWAVAVLFGPSLTDEGDVADQSCLIVDDALARTYSVSIRDGVRINGDTNLAYVDQKTNAGAKFDVELLDAGAVFQLHLELICTRDAPAHKILPYVAMALEGLENGQIRLGLRKSRGFGHCQVFEWSTSRYDMMTPRGLCAWLASSPAEVGTDLSQARIGEALGCVYDTADVSRRFKVHAEFGIEKSSILVRSGFGQADMGPDVEHLHARDETGNSKPVIPGTSWAGVLRHRALRIANTIAADGTTASIAAAKNLVEHLFGWTASSSFDGNNSTMAFAQTSQASQIVVNESSIIDGHSLYQTRVRIDRFTGGALDTALFEEVPVYGTPQTRVNLDFQVRNPTPAVMGLLLLLLRDLWTSDLPVGGEAAIGRGRLTGKQAQLIFPDGTEIQLNANQPHLGLAANQRDLLQATVDALLQQVRDAKEPESNG